MFEKDKLEFSLLFPIIVTPLGDGICIYLMVNILFEKVNLISKNL